LLFWPSRAPALQGEINNLELAFHSKFAPK
jgi:hypothetical protein